MLTRYPVDAVSSRLSCWSLDSRYWLEKECRLQSPSRFELMPSRNLGNTENQTRGCWARSKKASQCAMRPPCDVKYFWNGQLHHWISWVWCNFPYRSLSLNFTSKNGKYIHKYQSSKTYQRTFSSVQTLVTLESGQPRPSWWKQML